MSLTPLASGGYPISASLNNNSGTLFGPIWGKIFARYFYPNTLLTEITSNEYASELKSYGSRYVLPTLPTDINIGDYVDGQPYVFSQPTFTAQEMFINQGKYFAFKLTKLQKKQCGWAFDAKFAEHCAKMMRIAIEKLYLSTNYSSADSFNQGASAGAVTQSINLGASTSPVIMTTGTTSGSTINVVDFITNIHQVLQENNVPEEDPYWVVPPWLGQLMKRSELKLAYETGDKTSPVRTGLIGSVDGIKIFVSNLLAPTTDTGHSCYHTMFGVKSAVSFITQMTDNSEKEDPYGPSFNISGLQIYGYKTFLPRGLGTAYVAAS